MENPSTQQFLKTVNGDLVLPKATGVGVKVDLSIPTFGFKDLVGQIIPRTGGGAAPAFTAFRGTKVKNYAFGAGDLIDLVTFHLPHDYLPGSNIFIHHHWGHNGTAISGTLAGNFYVTYCKGYNQAGQTFNSELTLPWTLSTPNVATYPQWNHNIHEIALTNTGGDATHLDKDLIEIDGLIQVAFDVTTIPTITGSATSDLPYIFMVDLHYQSTQMATKDKNYPFYT